MLFAFKCGNGKPVHQQQDLPQKTVRDILTETHYNELFPLRDKFYSYSALMQAVSELSDIKIKITKRAYEALQIQRIDKKTGKASIVRQDEGFNEDWARSKPDSVYYIDFALFCTEKDVQTNKKELAAFFAHIAHETRFGENGKFNDGLMIRHEADTNLQYIVPNDEYPPVPGKKYYGRGPMQLSYNGNYGYASHCIFGNKEKLLNNPELIEQDAVTAFKTAIYFWMTPQSPKPSAHDAITGNWKPNAAEIAKGRVPGFASTTNIINGALECGKGDDNANMLDRIGFYKHFLTQLGTKDDNCGCSCGKMVAYAY
ncbi:chitinase [Mucilaginibacter hurinus]|nr:chitinase [Mucilaginibacter hurinus]